MKPKGETKMFFNQDSTCVLKAQLANAVAVSQLEVCVTYKDNTDVYHPEKIVATTGTTAVTLLDAPASGVINLVELIKIYNPDTQENTVQILANNTVIFTCAVGAGQSAILSPEGINIGLGYTPASTDLNNLTTSGKAFAANAAMPSDTAIYLTLGASNSNYTAPADGWFHLNKKANADGQYLYLACGLLQVGGAYVRNGYGYGLSIPAKKNDVLNVFYNLGGTTDCFRFVYAQGEV